MRPLEMQCYYDKLAARNTKVETLVVLILVEDLSLHLKLGCPVEVWVEIRHVGCKLKVVAT